MKHLVILKIRRIFAPVKTAIQHLKGEMAEWSNAPVLKTGVLRGTGGSNPSLSAKVSVTSCKTTSCADFSFIYIGRITDDLGKNSVTVIQEICYEVRNAKTILEKEFECSYYRTSQKSHKESHNSGI